MTGQPTASPAAWHERVIGLSQHPIDQLIRHLVRTSRLATSADITAITERMADAPFDRRIVSVPTALRDLWYHGQQLGANQDALSLHLLKRVVIDRQWAAGTTEAQYVADLRRAIREPPAQLAVYARRGGHLAVTLTPTATAVPVERRTPNSLPYVLVVYSADRSIIITGYQITDRRQTGIPQEARWLK